MITEVIRVSMPFVELVLIVCVASIVGFALALILNWIPGSKGEVSGNERFRHHVGTLTPTDTTRRPLVLARGRSAVQGGGATARGRAQRSTCRTRGPGW